MKDALQISTPEVSFEKQLSGYDRGQVNRYIANISEAYQTAYNEYTAVCEKYNSLLEDYRKLEEKEQNKPGADIIAKTLVDTESLAHRILEDAGSEAARITSDAIAEAKRITDDAYTERATIKLQSQAAIDEVNAKAREADEAAKKTIDAANLEAAEAMEKAQRIIEEANLEAAGITARAKEDREKTDAILRQSIEKINGMLTPRANDVCARQEFEPAVIFPLNPLKTGS